MATKSQMTKDKFKGSILPNLSVGCKTQEELQQKAVEFLSDTDLTDSEGNIVEVKDLDLPAVEAKSAEKESADINDTITKTVKAAFEPIAKSLQGLNGKGLRAPEPQVKVIKRFGPLKNFKDARGTTNSMPADERAFRFGSWALANIAHSLNRKNLFTRSQKFCNENGLGFEMEQKGHTENVNTAVGFLVPEEFSNDMIDLRLQYGVFRRNARTEPMMSDTKTRPRRTGGLTAYFAGEAGAGTESTMSVDRVTLTAKKLMVLTTISNELNEDAVVNIGDVLAGEIAYAFANKEDDCGFNGDGTSTYGGIVGVRSALGTINGVDEGGGLILAAGNAYSEIILGDFHRMIGITPTYARANAKWFVSPVFNDSVMQRLATAAGGNSVVEIGDGGVVTRFLGYPVELTEIMPVTAANSQVCALFGDLSQSSDFGDRRSTSIAFSDSALNAFEQDELAVRGTERFDINNHDLGTSTAAGPVVGLITAGS